MSATSTTGRAALVAASVGSRVPRDRDGRARRPAEPPQRDLSHAEAQRGGERRDCCQCENVANTQSQYPIGTGNIGTGNTSTMATFSSLPKGWEVKRFKCLFSTCTGISFTKAELVEEGFPVLSYGQIHSKDNPGVGVNKSLIRHIPGILATEKSLAYKGDFLFADTSEDLEGCGNCICIDTDEPLYAGSHVILAKQQHGQIGRFLAYEFASRSWRAQLRKLVNGVKVYSVTQSILNSVPVWLPPLPEQKAIVAYLDAETERIDKAIAAEEKMIALLQERREIVINEAVGGGDLSHAEAQRGRERRGWEVRRLKTLAVVARGGSPRPIDYYLSDVGYNWVKISDATRCGKYITSTSQKIRASGLSKTRMIHSGDLLLTNSMSFGHPYIMAIDGCIHDGWVALQSIHDINKEYFYYYLSSTICRAQFLLQVDGGVVQNLNVDKIGNVAIPLPPLPEQEAIVERLDRETGKIDRAIEVKRRQIELLRERRQIVIDEVVTGKVKVA